ncbi:unnamed protein product, partial [Closterium sp. Naga37s-1]
SLHGGPFLDALEARKRAAQGNEREQLGGALGEAVRPLVQGVAEWAVLGNVDARNEEFFVRCSAVAASKDVLWQEGFWMDEAMVPVRLIPLSLARTILRVGKSIRFLAHCCGDRLGPEAAKQVEREVRGARASLELRDVPRLVERVSAQVETRLVQVVVGQFNLLHHCALIKRFILLTNGHLAQVLLDEASSELKKPVNKVSTIALSGALHGAVLASLFSGEEPALADALQVKLVNDSTPGISGWDVFTLEYRILPPLTAVITTTAQHHYARLFTALFLLQRTRRALSSTWLALKPRASRLLPPVVRESITAAVTGRFAGGLGSRAAGASSKARKPDMGGMGEGAAAGAGTAAAVGAGGGSLEGGGGGGEGGARVSGGLQAWKEREEEKLLVGPVRGVRGVFARMSQFMRVIETFAALRIETSWKEMVEGAKSATNLDELIACHERYQQALLRALFLDHPSAALLGSVRRICRLVLELSHLAAHLQKHTDSVFA